MDTMDIFRYIIISVGALGVGAIAGGIGGLSLGWLLAFGYRRHGPSDPGDAPVYVTMGLVLVGACVGAILGFIIGIIYSVRLARRANAITG
jgi:positive regulator of sigma E activity